MDDAVEASTALNRNRRARKKTCRILSSAHAKKVGFAFVLISLFTHDVTGTPAWSNLRP